METPNFPKSLYIRYAITFIIAKIGVYNANKRCKAN